jgi:predicted ATPase
MVRYEAATTTKAALMFFLTGASGSGKSASLPGLRAALPGIDWRDFDEFGVPLRVRQSGDHSRPGAGFKRRSKISSVAKIRVLSVALSWGK